MATTQRHVRKGHHRPQHLQGVKADIADLILRTSDRKLELEIGPGITPTPMLTRTIDGASSISLDVFDPERKLLRNSLLSQKWEAEIDGLGFRYVGCSKQGQTLTLTLEDEWVAKLKEHRGPVKVLRKNHTRAEFIKRLVEEACPGLDFYCPQLKRKQPVGTKAEKKQSKKEREETRKENRRKGIGDVKGLNIEGVKLTASQKELASTALDIAAEVDAPFVVQVALIAALIVESTLGEATPQNVLAAEQEITGPGGEGAAVASAEDEISGFLTGKPHWTGTTALDYHKAHPQAKFYEIAQAVQGSAGWASGGDGSRNYGAHGSEAREIVEAYGGGSGTSGSITVAEPYRFEVKGKEKGKQHAETYWAAIKRLAKEVNWRFFVSANRAYFMPETELIRSMVRLAIEEDTPGVEYPEIGFEYNVHAEVTEVTVPAFVDQWKPPPGSVVTVAGLGPVSLGPGDASAEKGSKVGLLSNVKASTHEGRGRFLVSKIEVPLVGDTAQRLAQITLKTPTNPLPEPQAERKQLSVGNVTAEGNKTVERMLQVAERLVAKKLEYLWGGFDPAKGFDCSGWVSYLLNVGGFMDGRTDTKGLASFGEAGAGKLITVYDHSEPGMSAEQEHTMIEIAGEFFMSGGGENTNPNGGPCKFSPSEGYKSEFNIKRHPHGF